jgi:hypothetical protein
VTKDEYFKKLNALKRAAKEGQLEEVVRLAKQLGEFFYQLSEDAEELLWARRLADWYSERNVEEGES